MPPYIKNLGKVSISVEKDVWTIDREYESLTVVFDAAQTNSFISRQYVPIGIDINNTEYWMPFVSVIDSKTPISARVVNVTNDNTEPSASIVKVGNELQFLFNIPAGRNGTDGVNGVNGIDGRDGLSGDGYEFRFNESNIPNLEKAPELDKSTRFPTGWELQAPVTSGYIWMTCAKIDSSDDLVTNWSEPVRISGTNGTDGKGVDGTSYEQIYAITKSENDKPNTPPMVDTDDHIPDGWSDNPLGINSEWKCEWMCKRVKKDGHWQSWSEPALWSRYSVDGRDGDGIEYIYVRTTTDANPGQPMDNNPDIDEYIPNDVVLNSSTRWTDKPLGVDETNQYEWVSLRKYKNGKWSNFSRATLWAKYGKDGIDGESGSDGKDGHSIKLLYTKTENVNTIPPVEKNELNPGSIWGIILPTISGDEVIWGIQNLIDGSGQLVQSWTEPILISGIKGKDATAINYKTYVYKKSDTKPDKPLTNEKLPTGWVDAPDSIGQWWQCIGLVNGRTETVDSWSEVLQVNGKDGEAIEGSHVEMRFAGSESSSVYPKPFNAGERIPGNIWLLQPNDSYSFIYMTITTVDKDDKLVNNWSTPVRITGETGPQGNTGATGPVGGTGAAGAAGVPGVGFEIRFCLGTVDTFTGDATPDTDREPTGWSLTMPTVTTEAPYIWFIQARITKRLNGADYVEQLEGSWSKPARLSGVNGMDGANGRKAPMVYPGGVYNSETIYTCTETTAPYVYDPSDGEYYVMNFIGEWLGTEQLVSPAESYNKSPNEFWTKFDRFEAIFTKLLIAQHGLVGSAVFYEHFMFSQQGIDKDGNASTEYEKFCDVTKEYPYSPSNSFRPNACIDFLTGDAWFSAGKVRLGGLQNLEISDTRIGLIEYYGNGENKYVFLVDTDQGSGQIGPISWHDSDYYLKIGAAVITLSDYSTNWIHAGKELLLDSEKGSINTDVIQWNTETSANKDVYDLNEVNLPKIPDGGYLNISVPFDSNTLNVWVSGTVEIKYINQDAQVNVYTTDHSINFTSKLGYVQYIGYGKNNTTYWKAVIVEVEMDQYDITEL